MLFWVLLLFFCSYKIESTPLDDYVNTPDPHYAYSLIETYEQPEYTLYVLNMTSQKWFDETFSDHPIWWHYITVAVPKRMRRPNGAFLKIEGGHYDDRVPQPNDRRVLLPSLLAVSTGSVSAVVMQIPNQPIVFVDDPLQQRRTEDAVIAFTWNAFLDDTNNTFVPLRLPMTKAVVRAIDTIIDFAKTLKVAEITKVMVAGESKRGWTTWTTAAVDSRVFGAVPIVMDLLNLNQCMHSHYRALGGWTNQFWDYFQFNFTARVDTPEVEALADIVDPYSYLKRYRTKNMLIISTSGDEFFLPQDTYHFWQDLAANTDGRALFQRIPNAEHSLNVPIDHKINMFQNIKSFYISAYDRAPLPIVRWTMPNNLTHGILRATVDISHDRAAPTFVRAYYAKTLDNKRIDFRMFIMDPANPQNSIPHIIPWLSTEKEIQQTQTSTEIHYEVAFIRPLPNTEWFAFFLQFTFPGPEQSTLEVTTETNIIPETFPFEDCYRESCLGVLV